MKKKMLVVLICCLTLSVALPSFAGTLDGTLWQGNLLFFIPFPFTLGFYEDNIYFKFAFTLSKMYAILYDSYLNRRTSVW